LDADQDEYRICEGDCNDQDAEIHPGKEEILYNEKDDDCNPSTIDWPVKITSVIPNSYINSSPVEVTIHGSGFTPDSEVHLSSGGAFEVGIWNTLDNVYYVTINGDYAYVAVLENGLQVIDISDPTNPNVIGSYYDIPLKTIQDIAIKGNYAYVANQHNGLLVIDISDPSQPKYAGVYDTPGVAMGVALNGNYAYVADGNMGLQVLDITDPAHPELAGSFESLSTYMYSVSVKDSYAYVLSQGLEIIDISDPTQPLHIGSLTLGGTHGEIIVRDDYVYVSGEGLISIDVSDPANPRIVGNYKSWAVPYIPPGNYTYSSQVFWGLDISGNYAYLTGNTLQMIDITDPTNLRWVGSYNTPGKIYSIDVNENYAYIADWENGLRIIDILGLADPSLVGSYDIWGQVIDSSYPDNGPYYVSYPTTNTSYDLTISGNYAYAIYSSCYQTSPPSQVFDFYTMVKSLYQELRVIDISDPINPRVLGSYESTMEEIDYSSTPYSPVYNWIKTGFSALVVSEGYAYMTNGISLQVIDLRDPNHLTLIGNYDTPNKGISDILTLATGSGIAVSGNYAYMVNDQGLQIINITDPNHPIHAGSYATQGDLFLHTPLPGEACGVAVDGIYAYISNGRGFHVIDISDPADPRLVCTKQEILCNNSPDNVLREGLPCKLAISGSFVYLANWDRGVDVIDISDPNSPMCIGGYDTPGLACRITINNTYAYVADGEAGLQIIDITNPENPALIRGYSTPSYACGIAINNDYAYLADMSTLLLVIKIDPMTPAFANYTCTEISFIEFSTLSVTIPALLPGGAYNVMVENPDGITGTLPNGFYSICADCDNDGYTEAEGDCDDHNAAIYPGAPELCDGKDNDCDQIIPANELDEDQDEYRVCEGDPDDLDATIYPGAPELCDSKDNNVDGEIDEENAEGCITYYKDEDEDGYGVDEDNRCLCAPEGNYTANQGGDPDDLDPDVPGTIEEPCLFIAKITALKQVVNGFWDTSTVYIGLDTNVAAWPSPGPVPEYTVHMTISEDLLYDYRQTGSDYEEWHLIVRVLNSDDPNREEFFPLLNWDPNELCPPGTDAGYLRLYSEYAQGRRTLLVEDMYQSTRYLTKEEDGQYVFALDMYVFSYYIVWSKEVPIEMNMSAGWNMISLPVIPYDAKISDLFPEAVVVYGYEKGFGYVRVKEDENMEVGDGYWILFHEDQNYTLTGQPIQSYKKTLYEDGWEMIGGCTFPAQPSTDFCSIDVIYRYVPGIGYQRVLESEYIDSGRGYWILYNNIVDHCELRLETIGYSSRIRSLSGSQDISEDIKIRFKKDPQDIKWKLPITQPLDK
jgi:hypothetical protein